MELEQLTRRETDVVRLVTLGMTNDEIARELTLSYRTVQTHLQNIFMKWGVVSRTGAAMLAVGRYVTLEEAQQSILSRAVDAGDTWQ